MRGRRHVVRFVCTLFLGIGVYGVSGAPLVLAGNIQQTIQQERMGLEQIQKEIEYTKEKKKKVQEEHDEVLRRVEEFDQRVAEERRDYDRVNRKLKHTDHELEVISQKLKILHSRLRTGRQSILARLRLLYMDGRGGHAKSLLATRSYADFQRRYDYLSTISKREFALLESHQLDVEAVKKLQAEQAQARAMLLQNRKQTEKTLKRIKGIRSKKRTILVSLQEKSRSHEKSLQSLTRREGRKESLLKELEQRRKLERASVPASKAFRPQTGSLMWPADGEVVTRFGRQKHPTFDTYIQKKGIEIRTTEGSAIRAVSAGKVVYADWLKGYGLVMIVDHKNSFFSLYAHASKLLVKDGDGVKTGEIIGETGDSGLTEDNILYFELRKGTNPVDPLKWLVKRP